MEKGSEIVIGHYQWWMIEVIDQQGKGHLPNLSRQRNAENSPDLAWKMTWIPLANTRGTRSLFQEWINQKGHSALDDGFPRIP